MGANAGNLQHCRIMPEFSVKLGLDPYAQAWGSGRAPVLAVGDGALASGRLRELFPRPCWARSRGFRCTAGKAVFDRLAAGLALIVLAPRFAVIAVARRRVAVVAALRAGYSGPRRGAQQLDGSGNRNYGSDGKSQRQSRGGASKTRHSFEDYEQAQQYLCPAPALP